MLRMGQAKTALVIGASSSNEDAIFPELYPDLIESNDFLTSLFDVKVTSDPKGK